MPPELLKAHRLNDKAVMQAYGMPIKETDEAACVAWLMRLYQEKVNEKKEPEMPLNKAFPVAPAKNRGDGIRTHDLCVPNAALYQTEPRLEISKTYNT